MTMTDNERAAMVQGTAEMFVRAADRTCQGLTNEELTAKMLGTIAGAVSIMLASGLPYGTVSAAVSGMLADMHE